MVRISNVIDPSQFPPTSSSVKRRKVASESSIDQDASWHIFCSTMPHGKPTLKEDKDGGDDNFQLNLHADPPLLLSGTLQRSIEITNVGVHSMKPCTPEFIPSAAKSSSTTALSISSPKVMLGDVITRTARPLVEFRLGEDDESEREIPSPRLHRSAAHDDDQLNSDNNCPASEERFEEGRTLGSSKSQQVPLERILMSNFKSPLVCLGS